MIRVLAMLLFLAGPALADARMEVDVAIVFVADISTSMGEREVAMMREAHAVALLSDEVQSAIADGPTARIAVAYVEFANVADVRVGWVVVGSYESAVGVAGVILSLPADTSNLGCCTAVGAGLNAAEALFAELPYRALRLVVDVFGDGPGDDPAIVALAMMALRSRGAVVNGMPLMVAPDRGVEEWYAQYVKNGPGSFLMPINSIREAPDTLRRKIVLELY